MNFNTKSFVLACLLSAEVSANFIQHQLTVDTTNTVYQNDPKQICLDLHEYQNMMRMNPQSALADVQALESSFTDSSNPNMSVMNGVRTVTREGKPAVTELVEYLKVQPAGAPLEWNEGMVPGTAVHIKDCVDNDFFGHIGSDGSTPQDRQTRYGKSSQTGENMAWAYNPTGKSFAIQFAVDDGVASRGHRTNMFATKYTQFACFVDSYNDDPARQVVNLNYAVSFESPQSILDTIWSGKLGPKQMTPAEWYKDATGIEVPPECADGSCPTQDARGWGQISATKHVKQIIRTYTLPNGSRVTKQLYEEKEFGGASEKKGPKCSADNTSCGAGMCCMKSTVKDVNKGDAEFSKLHPSAQQFIKAGESAYTCLSDADVAQAPSVAAAPVKGVTLEVNGCL